MYDRTSRREVTETKASARELLATRQGRNLRSMGRTHSECIGEQENTQRHRNRGRTCDVVFLSDLR